MKRLIKMTYLGVLISVLSAIHLMADEINKLEIRTIGIPPYGIENNNQPSGVYYDAANLLIKRAGYQANNLIYPYARIINELKSGETDLTIMFKYEELTEHVIYITPLPTLRTVVIGRQGSIFKSIDDLKGKTIAYLRGARFSDLIDNQTTINKQVTDDFTQGAQMLMSGRVDGLIGPLDPIIKAIESINSNARLGEPLIVDERTPWVQISKKSVDKVSAEKLNKIFLEIILGGELNTIKNQYGANNE